MATNLVSNPQVQEQMSGSKLITELPFNSYACIIGINEYEILDALDNPINDAAMVRDVLVGDQKFKKENVWFLEDPDEKAILSTLEHIRTTINDHTKDNEEENSRFIFYFAGHGVADTGGDSDGMAQQGYLLPRDADPGNDKHYLSMGKVAEILQSMTCKHVLVLLDCCYSGAFKWSIAGNTRAGGRRMPKRLYKEVFDRFTTDNAWQVITSAGSDQEAADEASINPDDSPGSTNRPLLRRPVSKADPNHSPFAIALAEGLAGKADLKYDKQSDGIITATELYNYIRTRVETDSIEVGDAQRQTPSLFDFAKQHDKGEFVFLNPNHPANLPERIDRNPYKGLNPYTSAPEDVERFYGRDELVIKLRDKVFGHPLAVLKGASASGKTSLIKAGLLPMFKNEGCNLLPVIEPGENPVANLEQCFREAGLMAQEESFDTAKTGIAEKLSSGQNVLAIDQYEQLESRCQDTTLRKEFASHLKYLLDNTSVETLKIILTMRSDFDPLHSKEILADYWEPGIVPIENMDASDLREIIELPLLQDGILLEDHDEMRDQILSDVGMSPGTPSLISETLYQMVEMYRKAGGTDRTLRKSNYYKVGGARGLLRERIRIIYDEEMVASAVLDAATLEKVAAAGLPSAVVEELGKHAGSWRRKSELHALLANQFGYMLTDEALQLLKEKGLKKSLIEALNPLRGKYFMTKNAFQQKLDDIAIPDSRELIKEITGQADIAALVVRASLRYRDQYFLVSDLCLSALERYNLGEGVMRVLRKKHIHNRIFVHEDSFRQALENGLPDQLDQPFRPEATFSLWQLIRSYARQFAYQNTMRKLMLRMVNYEDGELTIRKLTPPELEFNDPWETKRAREVLDTLIDERIIIESEGYYEPANEAVVKGAPIIQDWIARIGEARILLRNRLYSVATNYDPTQTLSNWRQKLPDFNWWQRIPDLWKWAVEPQLLSLHKSIKTPDTWLSASEMRFVKSSYRMRIAMIAIGWVIAALVVISLIVAFENQTKSQEADFYARNFATAKQFEEEASRPREDLTTRELHKSWLYTMAALGQDLKRDQDLPLSQQRLIRQAIEAGMYQQLWRSPGSLADINDLAVNSKRNKLAIAGGDGTVRFADLNNGLEMAPVIQHSDSCRSVDFSPDGKLLVAGFSDGQVIVAAARTHLPIDTLKAHTVTVRSVATARTHLAVDTLKAHTKTVRSVAFSPDGRHIASVSDDKVLRIWVRDDDWPFAFKQLTSVVAHEKEVLQVVFHPDDETIFTCSKDKTIRRWKLSGNELERLKIIDNPSDAIWSIAVSPDGKWLASASADTLHLYDLETNDSEPIKKKHKKDITRLLFSADSNKLYSASSDGKLSIFTTHNSWASETHKQKRGHKQDIWALAVSTNGDIISGSSDGDLQSRNGTSGDSTAIAAGHRQDVMEVDLLQNDSLMLTIGKDGIALFWDRYSGKVLNRFDSHTDRLTHVRHFTIKDQQFLLAAARDSHLRLLRWQMHDGRPQNIRRLAATADLGKRIVNLAISGDRKTVAAVTVGGSRVYKYATLWIGKVSNNPEQPIAFRSRGQISTEDTLAIALNLDGSIFASGTAQGMTTVRFLEKARENIPPWQAHKRQITALAFKPDMARADNDPYLVSGSADSELRGWRLSHIEAARSDTSNSDTLTAENIRHLVMRGHEDQITRITFYQDGRYMASGSSDRSIRIWEVDSGSELEVFYGHDGDISSLAISGDSSNYVLLSGSADKTAMLWDIQAGIKRNNILHVQDTVRSIAFNKKGTKFAATDQSGHLRIWDIHPDTSSGNYKALEEQRISTGKSVLLSAAFSPKDSSELAVGSKIDFMRTLNSDTRKLAILPGQDGDGIAVAYSRSGRFVANGSSDKHIRIWDTKTGQMIVKHKAHTEKIRSLAFHPQKDSLLASSGSDKKVYLWQIKPKSDPDVRRNAPNSTLALRAGPYSNFNAGVWSITFSHPDGNQIACASWDNSVRLWNYKTGQERSFYGHRGPVLSIATDTSGEWLATGSWDETVRLWHTKTGKEIALFDGHQAPVRSVAFHPSGDLLVSGGSDGTIRMKDIRYLRLSEISAATFTKSTDQNASQQTTGEKIALGKDPVKNDLALLSSNSFNVQYQDSLPFKAWVKIWQKRLSLHYDLDQQKIVEQPQHFYLMPVDTVKVDPIHSVRQLQEGPLTFLHKQAEAPEPKQSWTYLLDILFD